MSEIKSKIADAINDTTVHIKTIQIVYKSRFKKFLSLFRIIPRHRDIHLSNIKPSALFRLVNVSGKLNFEGSVNSQDFQRQFFSLVRDNYEFVIDYLAIAIHNKGTNPPGWIYEALNNQFSIDELHDLCISVQRGLDPVPFFGIISSITAVNLQVKHTLESTAPGQSSETSANTTDGQKIL